MFYTFFTLLLTLWFGLCTVPICLAEESPKRDEKLPLYEYGIIGLGARLPHYRGSDEYRSYAFPLPYFVYRGDRFKASRDGVRAIVWGNKRLETGLSLSGNPPVSSDNEARQGMNELDGIIELGPALRYYFYQYGERDAFFLQANLRPAISFGFDDGIDIGYQGIISDLAIVYRDANLFKEHGVRFHFNTGPQFGDKKLHEYFYGVEEKDVTQTRSQYSASAGYGGWQLSGSVVKDVTAKLRMGIYGRWINSSGAVFDDSPLFKTENNYVVGALIIYTIGKSTELEQ